MQKQPYTVSQLTNTIKKLLEGQNSFKGFVLEGEVSNFTKHHTGHLYFALKDERSQIRAIMFAGNARRLTFNPKSGDKVTVTGSINVYAPQGSYSIQVTKMQPKGAGALYQKYLELKQTLEEIGWFSKPKKAIPMFPKNIGVVTSSTGAVIKDIQNTINRRYRLANIILYSTLVQGSNASESIAKQIKRANLEDKVDLLIVGRGGGSIEDLWAFNEMPTIEAIYTSKIPIIAAIGHESDNTLSDLVADLRAPTPTAAAELATPNTLDLVSNIKDFEKRIKYHLEDLLKERITNLVHLSERLEQSGPETKIANYYQTLATHKQLLSTYSYNHLSNKKNKLQQLSLKLKNVSPNTVLRENRNKVKQLKANIENLYYYKLAATKQNFSNLIDKIRSPENLIIKKRKQLLDYEQRIKNYYNNIVYNKKNSYNYKIELLEKVNPTNIMKRGFAIIKDNKGIVTSVKKITVNSKVNIELADGIINAKVINKKER